LDEELTGRENLEMVGRLYRLTPSEARARAAELLHASRDPWEGGSTKPTGRPRSQRLDRASNDASS
jgi:ABC-2 type transport system ATP-binding protein